MKVVAIVAMASNRANGKNNQLIWHIKADLQRFKAITLGHFLITGRKNFESIVKLLSCRTTLIISRNTDFKVEGAKVVNSLSEAIKICKNLAQEKIFIMGGGEIYKLAFEQNLIDEIDLTYIKKDFTADTFFPEIDLKIFSKAEESIFYLDEKSNLTYKYITYRKNLI